MDTSSFIVMGHFFPERFPSFWLQLNNLADQNLLVSVSEVWKELEKPKHALASRKLGRLQESIVHRTILCRNGIR